jgi:hypothetical protein
MEKNKIQITFPLTLNGKRLPRKNHLTIPPDMAGKTGHDFLFDYIDSPRPNTLNKTLITVAF